MRLLPALSSLSVLSFLLILAATISCERKTVIHAAPEPQEVTCEAKSVTMDSGQWVDEILASATRTHGLTIELVFPDGMSQHNRDLIRAAAIRWENIILNEFQPHDFSDRPLDSSQNSWFSEFSDSRIRVNDVVDELRIYVLDDLKQPLLGSAAPLSLRKSYESGYLFPIVGVIWINFDLIVQHDFTDQHIHWLALHEIGHVIGIGLLPQWLQKVGLGERGGTEFFFAGSLSFHYFKKAGFLGHPGVPVEPDKNHWRESVLGGEFMTPEMQLDQPEIVSAVTLGALRDLHYTVNMDMAEFYQYSRSDLQGAGKLAITPDVCSLPNAVPRKEHR